MTTCVEFKLAHNPQLKHGLTTQLPLYLKARPSESGIYLVMWFKDEAGKYFNEPVNKNKLQMLAYLEEAVKEINKGEGCEIESILIDASIKPFASRS